MESRLNYINLLSTNLENLFSSGYFLDISLNVSTFSIKCNSLLLAASSDYFRALLKFDETAILRDSFVLKADYLTHRGVQHVINYVNSLGADYKNIPQDEYGDVYAASSFLQVVSLQQHVRDLVLSSLSINNALWFLQFASMFGDQEISRCAVTILQDGFHSIDLNSPEFLGLSSTQIEFIFLGNEINVPKEAFMVKALLRWVSHDQDSRIDFFKKNFTSLLRLSMVSIEDFRQIALDPEFQRCETALLFLLKWFKLNYNISILAEDNLDHFNKPFADFLSNSALQSIIDKQRCLDDEAYIPLTNPDGESARVGTDFRVYSVGGVEDEFLMGGHPLDRAYLRNTDFFAYSANLKKMIPCPPIPNSSRIYHAIAASHTWIYLTGGELADGTILSSCERFNLVENTWCKIADLDAPRSHHGLAFLDGIVYLFGGYCFDKTACEAPPCSVVLSYNHISNHWLRVKNSLPKELVDMSVLAIPLRDVILIIGGLERDQEGMKCSSCFFSFSPSLLPWRQSSVFSSAPADERPPIQSFWENTYAIWKSLPPLPHGLSNASSVYHEGADSIYIAGGLLSSGSLSNQIISFNFLQEQWNFVTYLHVPRYNCSALIRKDKLYVLGGLTDIDLLEGRFDTFHFNDLAADGLTASTHPADNWTFGVSALIANPFSLSDINAAGAGQDLNVRLLTTFDNPLHQMGNFSENPDEMSTSVNTLPPQQSVSSSLSSETSISSTISSWNSLFPDGPVQSTSNARVVLTPYRTCFIPEVWRIVKSSNHRIPYAGPAALNPDSINQTLHELSDAHLLHRPLLLQRDVFAPYWLDPVQLKEAMGWRRFGSSLSPTLRRMRSLARYCLAPFFHLENMQSSSDACQLTKGSSNSSPEFLGVTNSQHTVPPDSSEHY